MVVAAGEKLRPGDVDDAEREVVRRQFRELLQRRLGRVAQRRLDARVLRDVLEFAEVGAGGGSREDQENDEANAHGLIVTLAAST